MSGPDYSFVVAASDGRVVTAGGFPIIMASNTVPLGTDPAFLTGALESRFHL